VTNDARCQAIAETIGLVANTAPTLAAARLALNAALAPYTGAYLKALQGNFTASFSASAARRRTARGGG
jgi:hypothetical protein